MIGPVGAVLAVPASLFVKAIFVDVDPERRWLTPLLSNAPNSDAPDTEARLRRTTPENRTPKNRPPGWSKRPAPHRRSASVRQWSEGRAPLRTIMRTPESAGE